ncbi:MAG TPA: hypothetical protein VHB68_07970 [Steroidobacteraceae bacterium]|nr:hypothetical protein [Steroidobacteraceae bacterium]
MASSTHETNERRQAIWPWLLMPLVVLLIAYTLHSFEYAARTAAAQTHTPGNDADPTSEP